MNDPERGGRRFFSAWLPGPLAVVLGLGAHLVSGGAVPAVPIVLALTVLLGLGASILSRLRLPDWVLFLLCGLAQQVVHLALSALSGTPAGGAAGHGHGSGAEPRPQLQEVSVDPGQDLHLMLYTHVAAALLTLLVITQAGNVVSRIRTRRRQRASRVKPADPAGRRGGSEA